MLNHFTCVVVINIISSFAFVVVLPRLFVATRLKTTTRKSSEHYALSSDAGGAKSSHKLHASFDAINNHVAKSHDEVALNFFIAHMI